jgi:hypothetical protein
MIMRILGGALALTQLVGCAGYIGSELGRMEAQHSPAPQCGPVVETTYSFTVKTDIENGGRPGFARSLSELTLGIIPTYRPVFGWSEARLQRNGLDVSNYRYKVSVHEFYGLLWVPLLIPVNLIVEDSNSVPANEGVGLASGWGVKDKTASVAFGAILNDLDIPEADLCYEYTFR